MTHRHLIVDLSNNNGDVDLARVKQAGVTGMWHKVTEGPFFVDHLWATRRDYGRREGIRVGGYHFAHPGSPKDAIEQARFFVRLLGPVHRRDLAPALDLEINDGMHPVGILEFARAFNHEVRKLLGLWPLFYSYPSFIDMLEARKVIGRGLWLASYSRNDGQEHPYRVPRPFKRALAHQFTSNARIAGVHGRCDLSSAPRLVPILAKGWRGL